MNCASVKITGSGTSKLEGYDDLWVGDMNLPGRIKSGECRSKAKFALVYPNPGPFITITPVSGIPFGPPTDGTCFVGPGKGKSTGSGSGDSGQGTGSGSGGDSGSGDGGSSAVTKSESIVVSSPVPSATTSIARGKTTVKGTTTKPLAGNGNGSGGDALLPTTTAVATNPVAGGSGAQTTDPGIGSMFPTHNPVSGGSGAQTTDPGIGSMFPTQVVVPSKTRPVAGSRTKTKTSARYTSTSVSCGEGGNGENCSGSGSGSGNGSGSGSGNGSGSGSGNGSGSGSGSGSGDTNAGTGAGTNTTPATTQKPWTKIYTPTTFQTKFSSL